MLTQLFVHSHAQYRRSLQALCHLNTLVAGQASTATDQEPNHPGEDGKSQGYFTVLARHPFSIVHIAAILYGIIILSYKYGLCNGHAQERKQHKAGQEATDSVYTL